ncbi:MAG: trypsin-like peptidase domain-containing protein [Candidatus Limnocylindrales bacterium]
MVFQTRRRKASRLVASILSLVFVGIVAAACGASTGMSTTIGLKASAAAAAVANANPTGAANVPAGLQLATATPTPAPVMAVSGAAGALQDQMVSVIQAVKPEVVQIETNQGLGSGIIYDSKGDIVTNAHVVGTSTTFTVTLSNGHSYPGTLVGTYVPDDIAVINISATGLTPATFGDSSALSVGDFVLAIGNPLGLQSSVTEGIVSALGRQVSEPNGNALPDVIQTSAAINPGNSGGALVDLQGEVVGIPTLAATDAQLGGSAPGIGFAISSNRAKTIADQLISSGKVTNSGRSYMGVKLSDAANGALIVSVVAGAPAATAGIVAGDVVVAIDGTPIPDSVTFVNDMVTHHPGDVVKLQVQHQNGTTTTISVTLGQLPG